MSRPTRRLVRSATNPTRGGDSRNPPRSSQLTMVRPVPGAVRAVRRRCAWRPGRGWRRRARRARSRPAWSRRTAWRGRRPCRRRRAPAGAHDGALAEAVDGAVAGQPADGHGGLEGHDGQAGGGGAGVQVAAEVEGAPGRAGVLDERAAGGEHAEHGEHPHGRPVNERSRRGGPVGRRVTVGGGEVLGFGGVRRPPGRAAGNGRRRGRRC